MFRGCRTLGFNVRGKNANSAPVGPHAPVIRGNIVALIHYCCRCTRGCVRINALHRVGGIVGEHSRTHDHYILLVLTLRLSCAACMSSLATSLSFRCSSKTSPEKSRTPRACFDENFVCCVRKLLTRLYLSFPQDG